MTCRISLPDQSLQTNWMLNGLLNLPKWYMPKSLVPYFITGCCIKSGPIHFFGLQIEKIYGLTNKLNWFLVLLFLIFGQRIQSANVWIIVQDHSNVDFVDSLPSNKVLGDSSHELWWAVQGLRWERDHPCDLKQNMSLCICEMIALFLHHQLFW